KKLTDWRVFFPKLSDALDRFERLNPSHDEQAFTSPTSTEVVLAAGTTYIIGDTFKATIYAKDRQGRPKAFGGDFFRARLIRDKSAGPFTDGIPCVVTDHWNGTYSVSAPLVQAAGFTLEVILVTSLEGISRLVQFTSTRRELGYNYVADLESGEKVRSDSPFPGLCGTMFKTTETCDYSNPRNEEPWFCIKPPSGVCSPIKNDFKDNLKAKYETMTSIKGSGVSILVAPDNTTTSTASVLEDCVVKNRKHIRPNGYMWDGRWTSLTCANSLQTVQETEACLRNKVVYFFGDSTIRMYSFLLGNHLKLQFVGPDSGHIWQNPKTLYNEATNITTYYRAHGPPLQNPGGPETRPYISDSLDGIRVAGKDTFIILNVGAHLHKFAPSIYIHRMEGIRDAVLRLLKRYPDTRFIYRGLDVLSSPLEWYFYRYDVIVREIFKGIDNFMFLDFWDLTTVIPQNDYHPPTQLTDIKSLVLFDFLC
uniref:NXPE C-terminal domain-containing protein n=1 Tax=Ciona savignyi TaxID=51511 RepID=H2YQV2_CIOSA